MHLKLVFKLAVQGLLTNRGRTILTTVGIIIGIATIVIVLAAGHGLEKFINDQISTFGANTIELEVKIPSVSNVEMAQNIVGGAAVTTLKLADFQALKALPNIRNFYAGTLGQYKSVYKNQNERSMIFATSAGLPAVDQELKITEGRFYTEREDESQSRVVVLGPDVKNDLFGEEDAIGKDIKINQQDFRVIGVTEKRGNSTPFFNFDKMIYMPLITAQKQLLGIDYVMFGFLSVSDQSRVDETVADITSMMSRRHGIAPNDPGKEDFRITSMKKAMEVAGTITFGMTLLVLLIAGISLIVGGVGIMNIMYLSVIERTREIGLRKAIGATNAIVRMQFLVEAILITVMGGIIGVVIGAVIVFIFGLISAWQGYNFEMSIGWDSVLAGLVSAMIFGVLFGLYPARKASALSPVEALRFE
jgi:putative ABC transport system permease protein